MLTGLNQQILTAYEELGMGIKEICEEFSDLDELSVKATLMQFSSKYREAVKTAPENDTEHNFGNQDLKEANDVILYLMRHGEDENLRGRMARYIRDDKKGRLDQMTGIKNLNVNIALFNDRLLAMREAKAKSKQQQIVDIESEKAA